MAESKGLSVFRFLEKLKAGLGAAGLVAVLLEGLLSSGAIVRMFGISGLLLDRLSGIGIVGLSIIVFFVVSIFSDLTEDESRKKSRELEDR